MIEAEIGFLERLQIYGGARIEDALLAGLVTGDPVLIIGNAGSAKTLLVGRIARELGLHFWAYDASKSMFDDLIGFPNPLDLASGKISYVQTPISIMDKEFVLIDEISRAAPSMQSKWLDIIRSRQVMGLPLTKLKYIVAAMNPPTIYTGAHPLDRALAGRFGFILPMPEARHMEPADLARVISHVGREDAPMMGGTREEIPKVGLAVFLDAARARAQAIESAHGKLILSYAMNIMGAFSGSRIEIDGRRGGMICRNAIAYLAVREEKRGRPGRYDATGLNHPLWDALRFSLPFAATGEEASGGVVAAAHGMAIKALRQGRDQERADAFLLLISAQDLVRAARVYRDVAARLAPADHQAFITRLEDVLKDEKRSGAEVASAFLAVRSVLADYQHGRVLAPADVVLRAMRAHREALDLSKVDSFVLSQLAGELLKKPENGVAARLAAQRSERDTPQGYRPWRRPGLNIDGARFTTLFVEIREEFERRRDEAEMEDAA